VRPSPVARRGPPSARGSVGGRRLTERAMSCYEPIAGVARLAKLAPPIGYKPALQRPRNGRSRLASVAPRPSLAKLSVVSCQRQGRDSDPPRDAWQAGGQATATGPPSPGRQVRLAFARGPVAATAITRKMASKFTPAVAIAACDCGRSRSQNAANRQQIG
jgi:hypothetical protein